MRATDSQGTSLDIEATIQHQHLGNECWTTYSTEQYFFFLIDSGGGGGGVWTTDIGHHKGCHYHWAHTTLEPLLYWTIHV